VLTSLPDTPERTGEELRLQMAIGPALMVTRGVATPEVEQTYARIYALAQQRAEQVPHEVWTFHYMRGEIDNAHARGQELLELGQRLHDATLLLEAHIALGFTLFRRGEVRPAYTHLEQGMALYDPTHHYALARLLALNPGVALYCYAARALWLLGYPAQALERSQAALTLSQVLSHPFSRAYALTWTAFLQQLRRDRDGVHGTVAELIRLSTEQGFPFLAEAGTFLQGRVRTE